MKKGSLIFITSLLILLGCRGKSKDADSPSVTPESVRIENVSIGFSPDAKPGIPAMENFAKKRCRLGLYLDNVKHISIDNVRLEGVDGEKLIADHYETLDTSNFCEG